MQDSNMVGGSGGITSFMGLVEGGDIDKMQDPSAILGNVQGSIGGYAALQALEGGHEEFKGAYGPGAVTKAGSGAASTKSAYDLFHTPHSFGTPMKAIGGPAAKKKTVSSRIR